MSAATRSVDGVIMPAAGTWSIDQSHSHLEFTVRHMMVGKTRGRFGTWSGVIVVAENPKDSTVQLDIDAGSIDTRDAKRDEHLRSADFFDVTNFPKLTFVSRSVDGKGTEWRVTGDLTIRGVTEPVELDLSLEGAMESDAFGLPRAAFAGEAEIDREDYGLKWNMALEGGGVLVGKKVKISFEVEAVRQAEEPAAD